MGKLILLDVPLEGGAVLHSGGITYALTFKKTYYKVLSYEMVNNWLIKSFEELGLKLRYGNLRKSSIKTNCFGTSLISDLVDQDGFKRIGSAQFRKKVHSFNMEKFKQILQEICGSNYSKKKLHQK